MVLFDTGTNFPAVSVNSLLAVAMMKARQRWNGTGVPTQSHPQAASLTLSAWNILENVEIYYYEQELFKPCLCIIHHDNNILHNIILTTLTFSAVWHYLSLEVNTEYMFSIKRVKILRTERHGNMLNWYMRIKEKIIFQFSSILYYLCAELTATRPICRHSTVQIQVITLWTNAT
jgi:hypothetical protein